MLIKRALWGKQNSWSWRTPGQACVLIWSNNSPVQNPRAKLLANTYVKASSTSQGQLLHWGPHSIACSRGWKDGDLVHAYLDSQTHWSPYLHESGSKWTLNVSPTCEEAVTQDTYVLLKYRSLFCLGPAMNCNVIWLDYSNIQWGEGIIHLQQMAWNTNCNSTARLAKHILILNWQLPQRL